MVSPVYIRLLLALLVLAAIAGITVVVLRSDPRGATPVSQISQQLPHNIDLDLKQARFSEIQGGLITWELVADKATYDKSGETAYLTAIRMEFPHCRSYGNITVTADNGEYLSTAKNVRLKGHVHVVTEDGADFTTSSLVYSGKTEQFSTLDPVAVRQQKMRLTAVGMVLSVKNQQARFSSTVAATIGMD